MRFRGRLRPKFGPRYLVRMEVWMRRFVRLVPGWPHAAAAAAEWEPLVPLSPQSAFASHLLLGAPRNHGCEPRERPPSSQRNAMRILSIDQKYLDVCYNPSSILSSKKAKARMSALSLQPFQRVATRLGRRLAV